MQVQVFFALAQVRRLAEQDPAMLEKPAFKAMLDGDLKTLASLPQEGRVRAGIRHPCRHDRG